MEQNEKLPMARLIAVAVVLLIIISGLGMMVILEDDDDDSYSYEPLVSDEYMILVDEPQSEDDMMIIASVSMLAVHSETETEGEYHPLFVLDGEGKLHSHEIWTIQQHADNDVPKYLFTNHDPDGIVQQLASEGIEGEVIPVEYSIDSINDFMRSKNNKNGIDGFRGEIKVASYKEALWVSPLAAIETKVITFRNSPTFDSQEEVWEELHELGVPADYILAVNPEDYLGTDDFYSIFNGVRSSYHIPSLSAVAAEVAAYRHAYVITDIPPVEEIVIPQEYKPMFPDPENPGSADPADQTNDMYLNNLMGYGYYEHMKYINAEYGPASYIALVGSAEALPQFELYDYSGSEPEYTSSDVVYGFLNEEDLYYMTTSVGRLINYNVQGMSNQIVRTFAYDRLAERVDVEIYSEPVSWRTHSSSWNGFEVADQRMQNSPGAYFVEDSDDEGFDVTYWSTLGPGGGYSSDGGYTASLEIAPELEASGIVAYRGHGSWHGSFYQWGYYPMAVGQMLTGMGDDRYAKLEGTYARTRYFPAQTGCIVSCENSKIHGLSYGGDPIDMERAFATSYLYAGAIGLCAATEVSYSNVGQDFESGTGTVTGEYDWDINDLWYAGFWDNTLNGKYENGTHFEEETSGAEATMHTENRYIQRLRDEFDGKTCSPFYEPPEGMQRARQGYEDESGMHWKEVSMFAFYGEPAFRYHQEREGENDWNRWHND